MNEEHHELPQDDPKAGMKAAAAQFREESKSRAWPRKGGSYEFDKSGNPIKPKAEPAKAAKPKPVSVPKE